MAVTTVSASVGHVSTDTDVPNDDAEVNDPQRYIEFNYEAFCMMAGLAGAHNDDERAALIGMDPKTIRRARGGIIGHTFMAKCVLGLRRHSSKMVRYHLTPSLDALFIVHERELVDA